MLVIRAKNGVEMRVPIHELESVTEVEPATGYERSVPSHPYIHREGVNRCLACWRERTHPSHSEPAVRER
jgi:hypothetical protein